MYVVGIDAHTRYLVLVVLNKAGERVLGPVRVPLGDRARLLAVLAPFRPLVAVVETSSSWPWLAERLPRAGIRFELAHAKRLRAIATAECKRDALDAELLARMQLAGLIPRVHPRAPAQREWAILVRHRATLVAQRTATVNRLHAQLHTRGLALARGRLLTRAGRQWLRTTAWAQLTPEQQRLARTHLRLVAHFSRLIAMLDRRIRQVAPTEPAAQLLETIPGIGPYRALLLCAELLPITRFATPAALVSYAGLAPTTRQSGERPIRHGGIPAGANRWVRGALVRAVVTHVRATPTSALTQAYEVLKARVGWPVARIATARKLARVIHAMLRTGQPWRAGPPSRGELLITHAAS